MHYYPILLAYPTTAIRNSVSSTPCSQPSTPPCSFTTLWLEQDHAGYCMACCHALMAIVALCATMPPYLHAPLPAMSAMAYHMP